MDTRFTLNRVDGTEAVVIVQDGFRRLRRRDFSASMDDCGAFSYLQPDKSASVRFYQRSGIHGNREVRNLGCVQLVGVPPKPQWRGPDRGPWKGRLRISAKPFNDRLCAFLLAWTSLVGENGLR